MDESNPYDYDLVKKRGKNYIPNQSIKHGSFLSKLQKFMHISDQYL